MSIGVLTELTGSNGTARFSVGAPIRVGSLVRMNTDDSRVYGVVSSLSVTEFAADGTPNAGEMAMEFIGQVATHDPAAPRKFSRGVASPPYLGSVVEAVDRDDMALVFARPDAESIDVGDIYQGMGEHAHIVVNDLLNKSFAILGTSGSGKSCSAALILHSILDSCPNGHVILLDPHNEYQASFKGRAEYVSIDNLVLPYWLLTLEEMREVLVSKSGDTAEAEVRVLKEAILRAKKEYNVGKDIWAHITVDTPVPYKLSALKKFIEDGLGALNKAENSTPFLRLQARLESLGADKRFSFMFSSMMVKDMMPDIMARFMRLPVANKPLTIVDLSGIPAEVTDVVVSVVCRAVFDFNLWSGRSQRFPVLLLCEEAHRYIPQDDSLGFEPTKRAISQIAKEGRKYGVSLGLITQRPSELSTSILSQCGTLFALRMSNDQDLAYVRGALPEGSEGLIGSLPALQPQESIVVGEGVSVPMRIRFANLSRDRLPQGESVAFAANWQEDNRGPEFADRAVARWRRQNRHDGSDDDPETQARSLLKQAVDL